MLHFNRGLVSLIFFVSFVRTEKFVIELTKRDFEDIRQSLVVQPVYFSAAGDKTSHGGDDIYEQNESDAEDFSIRMFKQEFEKSAGVLRQYGINLYTVNCKQEDVPEYCKKAKSYLQVFIFRESTELLQIGIESMFDVDSIVSNILQLALMREVPILQSTEELRSYEGQAYGNSDIIFSYQEAVGTPDHRTLVEVAYNHHKNVRFALTTDPDAAIGLPGADKLDKSSVWLLQCRQHSKQLGRSCPAAKFYGKMTMSDLSAFVSNRDLQIMHEVVDPDASNPFDETTLKTVSIFYDMESFEYVRKEATLLAQLYRGTIGILMVNVEKVDSVSMGLPEDGKIPVLGIKEPHSADYVFMESEEPVEFIKDYLNSVLQRTYGPGQHGSHTAGEGDLLDYNTEQQRLQYLQDVERQDDEVAMYATKLKASDMTFDPVIVLSEQNFDSQIQTRDMALVLYYLPFDALSTAALHTFVQAASLYQEAQASSVGEDTRHINAFMVLNCYDWPIICKRDNITSYPTIRVFRKHQPTKDHKGLLSPKGLMATVQLYSLPAPIIIKSQDEFDNLLTVDVDVINRKSSDANVLAFTASAHSTAVLMDVADQLHGELRLHLVHGDMVNTWAAKAGVAVPSVLIIKANDPYQPRVDCDVSGMDAAAVTSWTRAAVRPVFPELTPALLPVFYTRGCPLVVLFSQPPGVSQSNMQMFDILGALAADQHYRDDLAFSWMDRTQDMTQRIMVSYTDEHTEDTLVIAKLSQGLVYVYKASLMDQNAVKNWLKSVQENSINVTRELSRPEWSPHHPGFDFLAMMDEDLSPSDDYGNKEDEDEETHDGEEISSRFSRGDELSFQAEYNLKRAQQNNEEDIERMSPESQLHTEL